MLRDLAQEPRELVIVHTHSLDRYVPSSTHRCSSLGQTCENFPKETKTKTKAPEAPQENAMEDSFLSLNPRKKPSSKEELLSSDFEETAGSASLPRGRNP